jgi:hypothetical protein
MIWTYRADQEDPSWVTDVVEADGTAVDLSAMTLELKLVDKVTGATALTKTANVTGTAGGRITAAWALGELATVTIIAGREYHPHVRSTVGRTWRMPHPEADTIIVLAAPS